MNINHFSIENPLPPPWMRYPHIEHCSIGWRMSYGEGFIWDWSTWYQSLSETEQKRYREMFPQPKSWLGFYEDDESGGDCYNQCETVDFGGENGERQYSRERLIEEHLANVDHAYIFFWRPQIGVINESCLGQWQTSPFTADIDHYSCTEQYMMAQKAMLFNDEEMRQQILHTHSPKEMKALGRKVRGFAAELWDKTKYQIVLQGNFFKFTQNPEMCEYLLSTKGKVLVEASPLDKVWGIGLGANNPDASNPAKWRGHNLLGFALMEVRDAIARVYQNYDRIDWTLVEAKGN